MSDLNRSAIRTAVLLIVAALLGLAVGWARTTRTGGAR